MDDLSVTEQRIAGDIPKQSTKPAYELQKEQCDIAVAQKEIEEAQNQWLEVECIIPAGYSIPKSFVAVTYEEILQYFKSQDMSEYLKNIKPTLKRKSLHSCLYHWLIGPPKLKPELIRDRNLVFAIAQCPYDTSDAIHLRLLRTLYKNLTGAVLECPQYGTHWENIGFQGCNPATDLRGVGFLGLFHLIYLILNSKTSTLAKNIYRLSQHDIQHFPFCIMSINVTRIALEGLREGILNRAMNKAETVIPIVNKFYAGCFYQLYTLWKQQGKTILDSGYVIQDVAKYAKKNPKAVLESVNELQNMQNVPLETVQFSDIGDITLSVTT